MKPAKPNRWPLLLIPAVFGFVCAVAVFVSFAQRRAEEREAVTRARAIAAAQAWQQQVSAAAAQPQNTAPTPGTCETIGASNPNRTPDSRRSVASTMVDSFRRRYGVNAQAAVHGTNSDVLAIDGLRNCGTQLRQFVEQLGAGDYNSSARVLCTAYGFHRITCGIENADLRILDLNRDCVCSSRWDCTCPAP